MKSVILEEVPLENFGMILTAKQVKFATSRAKVGEPETDSNFIEENFNIIEVVFIIFDDLGNSSYSVRTLERGGIGEFIRGCWDKWKMESDCPSECDPLDPEVVMGFQIHMLGTFYLTDNDKKKIFG